MVIRYRTDGANRTSKMDKAPKFLAESLLALQSDIALSFLTTFYRQFSDNSAQENRGVNSKKSGASNRKLHRKQQLRPNRNDLMLFELAKVIVIEFRFYSFYPGLSTGKP